MTEEFKNMQEKLLTYIQTEAAYRSLLKTCDAINKELTTLTLPRQITSQDEYDFMMKEIQDRADSYDRAKQQKELACAGYTRAMDELKKAIPLVNVWFKVYNHDGVFAVGKTESNWGGAHHWELHVQPWSDELPQLHNTDPRD